ncbi:MAG: FliA/WhiG family RNA polymerase sigma factor [Balneolales bacterium]
MKLSLQELVNAYCDEPTEGIRNTIITESMPLVKSIIGKIRRPDTPLSQYEDIESAGIMGLLQALDSYDCLKKNQFNTFAYYRIRGSVIDYLRSIDQLPRNDRALFGKAQEAIDKLQQELGRDPEDDEVAYELNILKKDYLTLLSNVQQRAVLSLDSDSQSSNSYQTDRIEDPNSELPDQSLIQEDTTANIKSVIKQLKEKDKLILALYYYENLTLKEIALLLGLTEARISQIIGKLLIKLKSSLIKNQDHEAALNKG